MQDKDETARHNVRFDYFIDCGAMLIRFFVICFVAAFCVGPAAAQDSSPFVIIHGAWGGAHHWKSVENQLIHEHGRTVRRAALTGLGERSHLAGPKLNLDTHIRDVVNMIEFDDLKSVILIGHSYGGVVAQGVIDAIAERIEQVVYIDSHLLFDGECYLTYHDELREKLTLRADEAGDGWLIPVDWNNTVRDTPHPLATLQQNIKLKPNAHTQVPSHYWLLADGKPPEQDDRHRYYLRAVDFNYQTKIFSWDHNPQRTKPEDLVRELIPAVSNFPAISNKFNKEGDQ